MRKKLLKEFEVVDTNRDGQISKVELDTFFQTKGVDDFEQRTIIIDEVFNQCDVDQDQYISL